MKRVTRPGVPLPRGARHRTAWCTLVLACVALGPLASAGEARAQAVQLDQYRSAVTAEDGFAIHRPDDLGHLRWSAQLHLDYAYQPLVIERMAGDASTTEAAIVEHLLAAQVTGALGLFDRIIVFAGLPVGLVMDGESVDGYPAADGAGLGDVFVGARARLFGEHDEAFALGLQLTATFPTAQAAAPTMSWTGEDGVTLHPVLLAEVRPHARFRITANVGARMRATDNARIDNLGVSHELTYGLGITGGLVEDILDVHAEIYGSSSFAELGDRETSPLEAILGLRVQPVPGLHLGLAAGPGISRGYGTPAVRGVFTIGYAEPASRAEPEPEPEPAPEPTDRDGDGLLDADDGCPDEPEDADGFEDTDGCPDPDDDRDGILDGEDGCPREPEDADGFQDADGCPDPDNDGDHVLDGADGCPSEAEDADGFQDSDGCPDPDNDRDGLLDPDDRCPLDPGTAEHEGCPVTLRVDRETGQITILQRVEFRTSSDVILPESMPILEEVRAVLDANPEIRRVRIEGHTDDRGRDDRNLELSRRRAQSVLRWLSEHGIEGARLVGLGCGELHPIDANRTRRGRQANRRVEFHIIDPAPAGGARHLEGCVETAQD